MKLKLVVKQFPDGESYIRILNLSKIKNQKVSIFYRLYPEPDKRIFELLLILSRIKKLVKRIELFAPYLPYARQDRENKKGEAISADVLCKLLKNAGIKKLITYDCHFLPRPGKFFRAGLLIENHSASPLLKEYAKKYFGREKFTIISPDQGAAYMSEHALKKTRKNAHKIHKMEGIIDVRDKNVCIMDDMIATGGTILHCIKHLKERGAKKIIVGAVHGVFARLPAPEAAGNGGQAGVDIAQKILKSSCAHLFTTNAIPNKNKLVKIIKIWWA